MNDPQKTWLYNSPRLFKTAQQNDTSYGVGRVLWQDSKWVFHTPQRRQQVSFEPERLLKSASARLHLLRLHRPKPSGLFGWLLKKPVAPFVTALESF